MKAAQEERKNVEAELRVRITKEATKKVKEDMKKEIKPPLRFKDAIGRKYSFPFHLAQIWSGMEELIKQVFLHVEVVGPPVQESTLNRAVREQLPPGISLPMATATQIPLLMGRAVMQDFPDGGAMQGL